MLLFFGRYQIEIETPERAQPHGLRTIVQPDAAMNTEKPQQPR